MRTGLIVLGTVLLILSVGAAMRGSSKVEQAENCAATYGCQIVDPNTGEQRDLNTYHSEGLVLRNGGVVIGIVSAVTILFGLVSPTPPPREPLWTSPLAAPTIPPPLPDHAPTGFACVHCLATIDPTSNFCGNCGKPLPERGHCPFGCGTKLSGPELYCPGCGKALVTD